MIQELILKLIKQNVYEDQGHIVDALKKEGFNMTQSTLSRYFKRLGIIKKDGRYVCDSLVDGFLGVVSILEAPPNLIVVKTMPGHASAVAFLIEEKKIPEIIGIIAGDDTLMIAVNPKNLQKLITKLLST